MFYLDPFDTIVGQEPSNDPTSEEDGASEDGGDSFSDPSTEAGSLEYDDALPIHTLPDLDHITEMINKLDAQALLEPVALPGVFYAVAQTVFLIICFWWRELVGRRRRRALAGPPGRIAEEEVDG